VQLWKPENEAVFTGEHERIILSWIPAQPLGQDEWFVVSLRWLENGQLQYGGAQVQEPQWPVAEFYYGRADQPERRYEWDVEVVRITTDAQGNQISQVLSPKSETRSFYWR